MSRSLICGTVVLSLCLTSAAWAQFESPGSIYAAADAKPRPDARPWNLLIRTFFGHMDDVQTVPDSTFFVGDSDDSYMGVTVKGAYRLIQNQQWTAGVSGQFDHLMHLEDTTGGGGTSQDYDLTTASPGVFVAYNHELFNIPATQRFSYGFRHGDITECCG